jgi:hypothetical protein
MLNNLDRASTDCAQVDTNVTPLISEIQMVNVVQTTVGIIRSTLTAIHLRDHNTLSRKLTSLNIKVVYDLEQNAEVFSLKNAAEQAKVFQLVCLVCALVCHHQLKLVTVAIWQQGIIKAESEDHFTVNDPRFWNS